MAAILGPFEAWLLLRGMRTMHLRVQQSCASAMHIRASHFSAHPKIERVLYPGLRITQAMKLQNVKCRVDTAE